MIERMTGSSPEYRQVARETGISQETLSRRAAHSAENLVPRQSPHSTRMWSVVSRRSPLV